MLKKLLLFIILIITGCLNAQTFYWVGGSGNWNDMTHWSHMSGGSSANEIPSLNSNVIFDNASSAKSFTINALNSFEFKSITTENTHFKIDVIGASNVDLTINGAVNLNEYFYFKLTGKINLNPQSVVKYQFSHNNFNNDIFIIAHSQVELGVLSTTKSLSITGNFLLKNSIISANDLQITNSQMDLEHNTIQIFNTITLNNAQFTTHSNQKSTIICKKNDLSASTLNTFANASSFNVVKISPQACAITLISRTDPTCKGICDGTVAFDLSSCTNAPYIIQWTNTDPSAACQTLPPAEVAFPGATYSVNALCACTDQYSVYFENAIGEGFLISVPMANPSATSIIFSQTQPTCNGLCNGQIRASVFSVVMPLTISWAQPIGPVVTHSNITTKDTLKNGCAGTYTVTAINNNGCIETFTTVLVQPAILLANGSSSSITCNGFCTGSATVAPTGGTAPYNYTWSPSTSSTTSISNLCAGVVSTTVTDTKSCTAAYSSTITQPPAITLTVTKTNLICGSLCDGTASITATGGSGAGYTYTWSSGGSTGPTNNALCVGPYTVTVADNLNCVKVITFTLTAPPTLTATPTQTNLVCNSACIGAINLNPTGGTGAYTYAWSPPAVSTASTATALCAGPYTYTVTDFVNCTYINTVTITEPPAVILTVNHTDVTCFGACNGTATGSVSGGTGAYTYSWSPAITIPNGQGTNTIINLCPGTYTLKASDANGCFRTGTVTVTQPIIISPNTSSVLPTCNGICNGIIDSSPTGGTAPYTFTLQPSAGPPTIGSPPFTGLCAGSYTLFIKDALGCIITKTISLAQPNPITLSLSATALNCFNQCNSNISTVINGGTPTYTVDWGGSVTGSSISNQCAGVHTATVTDSKGCQATASINIASPPDMTITVTAVDPNCNTQCTGVATTTITGGTPNYTVNWSNGPVGNVNSNLCVGNYTATVTDFKGCIKTQTIDIITPPALTLTATNGTVSCAGSCDGTVSVTASGGTSGYFYSWNSSPVQTNSVAVGLCVGNYIASVTDSKGCVASIGASVFQPAALTTSISNVQPSCNICIGAATADGIGGTAPYIYSWSPGVQSVQTPTNLCVGVQTVTVTDSKGCTSTQTVQINQTINIAITANSNLLSCNGVCSGVAQANASGGTGPGTYSYTWTPQAPMQNTQTATNLCAGSHTVLVIDANGCSNTNVVSFTNPPAITLTVNQTNINCNSLCNGVAGVVASGGTGSFTYLWQPGGATTSSINGLCAGDYTVTATDGNNCSQTQVVTITQSNALTASFTNTDPSGCNATDGSISFVPGGGLAPYSFTWTPGGPVNPLVNLGDGTYILNIRDANGCTLSFTTTLNDPLGPTVTVTSNSIVCFGSCTGSASLSVNSGTPSFSVNWSLPIPSTNTSTVANGLCAGNYQATVTDANNCATNQTISISQPTQISSTGIATNVTCNGVCTGSINISPSGGVGPYTYSWSPAGGTVEDPTNLCAGNYSVNITDANNCSVTNTFVITEPPALTLIFNKKDVLCNGGCTGAVRAVVGGGSSPYSYTWTPVGAFVGSNIDTIINLCSGIYNVTVRDLNGCIITGTISIGEPAVLTSSINITNIKCNGQCNGIAVINPTGGTTPYSFSYNTNPPTSTQTVTGLCVGVYNGIVTDANNCSSSNSFTITEPLPIVTTLTLSNPKCNSVCNGSVATTVTGGSGGYQYNWSPSGGSVANPTGLCAGNYTLTVTDDSLCTHQALVSLVEPVILIANPSFTNPICSAGCNGIVTANPIGGTAPFSYLWATPSNTTQTVSGLCAGIYTLIVSDFNSCRDTQIVTLTTISTISVSIALSPATCGVSNGSIDVLAFGGTPNYTYNWLNPVIIGLGQQTNNVVTGIPAGIYTVVVNDAASCSSTVTILLSNSNGPSGATVTSTNVACKNQCNGAIAISNPVGGTSPYTINWINPVSTNSLITNLCAGIYNAQIEDASGCLLFLTDTIKEPQVIDDNENIVRALCFGSCIGSIELNPTGGNGGYTYSWTPTATTGTITNLCPGIYTATITDVMGCTLTASYNLPSITSITSNTVVTNNTCFNDCNGTILATNVAGGLPPYSYNWTDPLGQSTPLASGLCNGSYTVTIRDVNGCFNQIPAAITSPAQITFTPNVTQPGCGLCDGVAVVNPIGGTPNYTYLWSANNQVSNTATNLCAGLYVVQITDGNGCVSNSNVIVNSSSSITGETITQADVSCSGVCNGSVTVTAVGGTSPITYHWVHDNSSSQSLTGLCSGTYFCNMTDSNGCVRTASVIIGAATSLTITPQVTQSSCSASTGSITVNVTGGTGPINYVWLPAGNTATVTNLAPGSYTLTVSDGICSQTQIYSIGTVNGPLITFTEKDVSCAGIFDGNIALTLSAGTPTYSTLWSNGATTTSISALSSGNYSVVVTDAAGCKAVQNFSLGTLSPIIFSAANINNVLCYNNCDGSITSIPSGGSLPYTFSWTPTSSSAPTTNSLCAGNYSISVTDVNGCLASETYTIINPAALTLTAVVTDASCSSVPDGAVDITVVGGSPVYTFSWMPNGAVSEDLTNILYGTYTVSITDVNGCKKDSAIQINATIVVIAVAGNDTTFCLNGPVTLNGSNSIGGITYQWLELPLLTVISNTTTATIPTIIGTSTYVLVATNGSCIDKDSITVNVNALPIVDAGPFVSIPTLATAPIGGSPTSLTGVTYNWSPGLFLDNPTGANPTTSTTVTTIYTVTVADANGCLNSDTVTVFVYPEIKIPNGFSPNGDGKNDVWQIDLIYQFPDCEVEVYNRWGEQLFYSKGYTVPFNGQYKGKDLPVGTYYYIINLNHPSYTEVYTSPLTIFR